MPAVWNLRISLAEPPQEWMKEGVQREREMGGAEWEGLRRCNCSACHSNSAEQRERGGTREGHTKKERGRKTPCRFVDSLSRGKQKPHWTEEEDLGYNFWTGAWERASSSTWRDAPEQVQQVSFGSRQHLNIQLDPFSYLSFYIPSPLSKSARTRLNFYTDSDHWLHPKTKVEGPNWDSAWMDSATVASFRCASFPSLYCRTGPAPTCTPWEASADPPPTTLVPLGWCDHCGNHRWP